MRYDLNIIYYQSQKVHEIKTSGPSNSQAHGKSVRIQPKARSTEAHSVLPIVANRASYGFHRVHIIIVMFMRKGTFAVTQMVQQVPGATLMTLTLRGNTAMFHCVMKVRKNQSHHCQYMGVLYYDNDHVSFMKVVELIVVHLKLTS